MEWRYQVEAVLCAVLLLASIVLVAVRSLSAATGEVKTATGADQSLNGNSLHSTTRFKQLRPLPRHPSQQYATELKSPNDLGSLWDQGPAYDLSKDGPLDF
jgi:hypothetical protein